MRREHTMVAEQGFDRRLAARLTAAGFVVAAVAGTAAGRAFLEGVARHGPIVGMVGDPVTPPFAPPVVGSADTTLWLSIFESRRRAVLEGTDTEERVLCADDSAEGS